jgi:acyl-CoA synthetase (AMP-forming)/AMP-acid ligase II
MIANSLAGLVATATDLTHAARAVPQLGKLAVPGRARSMTAELCARVAERPNGLALAFEDRRFTFADVDRSVNRYAAFFRSRGIGRGDVVALLMDNRPDFLFIVFALHRLRAVAALINTNLVGAALAHAVEVCRPSAFLVGEEHADSALQVAPTLHCKRWSQGQRAIASFEDVDLSAHSERALPELEAPRLSDPAFYIYTSGTTGLPKAAVVTHKRWMTFAYAFARVMFDAGPSDVIYVTLPLYHSNAMLCAVGTSLVSGAAVALRRKFSASQFWSDVRKYDATLFMYIGELCRYLLNAPASPDERNHRIRAISGNGLRGDIWQAFQQRFGIPLIREFYGSTEGNAGLANLAGKPGMVGRLRPGLRLVRCDLATGELARDAEGRCLSVHAGECGILLAHINPLSSFDGYLDKAASQKKIVRDVRRRGDRWFNTGDILQLHEHGWLSFADRVGDTFRWKGENVSTNEVSAVLDRAPGVLESNVYGVAIPRVDGRVGMASLNVDERFDVDQLGPYVCEKLAMFQRPYFIRIQRDMRITGTFKHQKASYRDEGFDPSKVDDPLYVLEDGRYLRVDAALYQRILAGELGPR